MNFGFYFGYGAFSSKKELRRFLPYSINLGKHYLSRYKSGYCMVSKDGTSATFGIQKQKNSTVKGRLYFLFDFNKLDKIEGLDRYERKLVFLYRIIPIYVYVPISPNWQVNLPPSHRYREIIEKEIGG